PCFTNKPCPALTEETDWCHHDVPWQRPEFIRVLDGMTGHIRQSLKFTYIVMGKRDIHLSDVTIGNRDYLSTVRVVSERFEEKGRIRVFGCNDRGRCAYSMNKRDKSDDNLAFKKIERYDVVQLTETEEKSNYVGIGKNTKVRIVE
ncbi:MAG TPA: small ribosomal subunit Rsm22 family protein, partial [bacterium]|nr:small ribosomal subunit Rsm22 family protein [bacterium]